MRPEDSLLSRLSERDRRDSEIAPRTPVGSFLLLYQFPRGTTRTATGYRLYWGIYVIPVSWLTRPYLMAMATSPSESAGDEITHLNSASSIMSRY